jgi:GAF domain-containing protein
MTDDRAKHLAQLRQAYESGILDEDTYLAAATALDTEASFQATAESTGTVSPDCSVAADASDMAVQDALEDTQRQIRDLQILNDIAQIMATKLDTQDLLRFIVSQIAQKLECTHCAIFFPQEDQGEIWLTPQVIESEYADQIASRRFKPGEGIVGWTFENGEPLMLADARDDPRFSPARARGELPRSMLVVPIKIGNQTIGVISADQDLYGWFTQSNLYMASALAQQAGIAIQRNRGLELLQDIGSRINSAQRVEEILQLIVSGAIQLTNTTSGVIYLIGDDGQSIKETLISPLGSFHSAPRMDREDGLTRRVISTGKVLVFSDIARDDSVNPDLYPHYHSMIAVPLKHQEQVIGVLYLNARDRHEFSEAEISLLLTLGNQAATAINKANLLRDTERQVERHRTLNEVGAKLIGMLDEKEILEAVAHVAGQTLGCSHCSVFRVEPVGLVVQAAHGSLAHELQPGRTFELDRGVAGWVARERQPALVPDTSNDPRFDPTWSSPPPRSLVNVPILLEDKLYGVISAEDSRLQAFRIQDQQLLETLALQVSQAVRSVRRIHDLQVLNRAGHLISSQLDIAALLDTLLDVVCDTLNCQSSTLFVVEPTGKLIVRARRGRIQRDASTIQFHVGEGLAGWVAQNKRSLNVLDVNQDSRYIPIDTILASVTNCVFLQAYYNLPPDFGSGVIQGEWR